MINLNLKPVWSLPAQKPSNKQSARLHCNCASGNANACVTLSLAHQPTTTHPAKKNLRVEQKKPCKSFSHLIRWWAIKEGFCSKTVRFRFGHRNWLEKGVPTKSPMDPALQDNSVHFIHWALLWGALYTSLVRVSNLYFGIQYSWGTWLTHHPLLLVWLPLS